MCPAGRPAASEWFRRFMFTLRIRGSRLVLKRAIVSRFVQSHQIQLWVGVVVKIPGSRRLVGHGLAGARNEGMDLGITLKETVG